MHVGIRSPTAAVDALVRELLQAYVVDVEGAPANYSLLVRDAETDRRPTRHVHLLYRSLTAVARSRNPGRVVHALLHHLDSVAHPPADHLLTVRAIPLLAGDRAMLVPIELLADLKTIQPHLRRAGLRVVDVPYATLDPATAALVVPPCGLDLHPGALAKLDQLERSGGTEDAPVAPGHYPLAGWAFLAGDPTGLMSAPRARLWAYPTAIDGARRGVPTTLGNLDHLLARTTSVSVAKSPPALARRVAELAASL